MHIVYYKDAVGNFGDDLNELIWPRVLPDDVRSAPDTVLVGIGSLLDEAAAMAGDNTGLIDAIDRLRDPLTRGVRSSAFGAGPVLTVKSLQARERWAFDVEARGGEILRVAAIGDGDTNIDLTVRDARGAVVCRDGFGDHYPVCTVSPRTGGQMRVDIVNRGDVWTKVQVLSN